jgi:putative radical SAM enzyme (TIGR03279 family)
VGRKGPSVAGGVITAVQPGSLAEEVGLKAGDRLVAINDHLLRDIIDVQFYSAEETLEMLVERDGKSYLIGAERDYDQELGLSFANPTFDVDIRRCANNCDFCFVKQNARGMRRSLYIKDDDYRYSFLFGNFVTLTNLTEEDWSRLEEQRLSPLYVSVHATDLALRRRFLARASAPDVMEQLRRLASLGIEVHTQVVLVPGLNDGQPFVRTVADLAALYGDPVASVGVVPIGLTRYHHGQCRTYTPEESRLVLDQIEPWRQENRARWGESFVYPSDEWYLVAGRTVPPADEYDGFPQVENGVGMVRQLLDEWAALVGAHGHAPSALKPATLVCGTLIAPVMARIVDELNERTGARWRLVPVVNQFFGPVTTVSGLLTGRDVMAALQRHQQADGGRQSLGEVVFLPSAMFTAGYGAGSAPPGTTLDDVHIADIGAQLGVSVKMAGTLYEALDALA